MSEYALPCFKCGKELLNVDNSTNNHPNRGTEFTTEGHYGSTFWDPVAGGHRLVLNICDECLRVNTEALAVEITTREVHLTTDWRPYDSDKTRTETVIGR